MISCKSVAASPTSLPVQLAGRSSVGRRESARSGFTLLEVLIATAVTLIMMISLAQIFKIIGDSMQQGRSVLQLNNQLRNVAYRIRNDLDNLTVIPAPPIDPTTGQGYLQIFDGSITDFTTATTISQAASRFGDVDDILMGTIRAGDVWFTGKVPRYVIEKRPPVRDRLADFEMVSIASQHAEVAVFLQPLVTSLDNPNRDPAAFLTDPRGAIDFEDSDLNNFPDSFRLHYRTLLIRPDLNLSAELLMPDLSDGGPPVLAPAGALPGGVMDGSISLSGDDERWTISQPQAGLPWPLCDMSAAHQQCDLSMRRVFNTGTGSFDFVAANSLQDLVNPGNRFAHVQMPLINSVSTSMPVLALGQSVPILIQEPDYGLDQASFRIGSGFLHPAYVLRGSRAGEDLLAGNVLAFDIKIFDPGVALISSPTGDLVLSPNDPGYASVVNSGTVVANGEYVDLAWAKKMFDHFGVSPADNRLSPLGGFSTGTTFTESLRKSGNIFGLGTSLLLLQPTYDTYTSGFEGDGLLHAQLDNRFGVCRINGAVDLYDDSGDDRPFLSALDTWRTGPDMGTDGIDNASSSTGVDDASEKETSAPFPVPLRGLKITVRMEDPTTRQVKQMSAAKEFISH